MEWKIQFRLTHKLDWNYYYYFLHFRNIFYLFYCYWCKIAMAVAFNVYLILIHILYPCRLAIEFSFSTFSVIFLHTICCKIYSFRCKYSATENKQQLNYLFCLLMLHRVCLQRFTFAVMLPQIFWNNFYYISFHFLLFCRRHIHSSSSQRYVICINVYTIRIFSLVSSRQTIETIFMLPFGTRYFIKCVALMMLASRLQRSCPLPQIK